MKLSKNSPRYDYHKAYYEARRKMRQKGGEPGKLSEYGRFFVRFLGFNFYNSETKKILTKREYFDLFGDTYLPEWKLIPWKPGIGWLNASDKILHFEKVQENYKSLFDEILAYENEQNNWYQAVRLLSLRSGCRFPWL